MISRERFCFPVISAMLHLEDCISWEMYSNLVSSKGNMHEVEKKVCPTFKTGNSSRPVSYSGTITGYYHVPFFPFLFLKFPFPC
jgi:hypothetical protein